MDIARTAIISVPEKIAVGPAMSQLTDNQQNYVWALVETGGDEPRAADLAGYGGTTGSRDVALHRLRHNPKVLAAIKEVAEAEIKSLAFLGAKALREIVNDPGHKDRLKAADMVLNRSGLLVIQETKVMVEHKNPDIASTVARVRALALGMGMDPKLLLLQAGVPMDIIDAEFEEIKQLPAPEEDMWTVKPE